MVTLREFLQNEDLFTEITTIEPFPFIVDNESILNLMLVTNYGDKIVFKGFIDAGIPSLANMLVLNFQKTWENYVKFGSLTDEINNSREVTETINNTEDRTNSKTGVNKVSGFNSEVMVDDTGDEVTGTDGLEGETIRTMTDTQIDGLKAFQLLNVAVKNSIIKSVLDDISGYLTLDIY